jgi:hypothetical protein
MKSTCLRNWSFPPVPLEAANTTVQYRGMTDWVLIADGASVSASLYTFGFTGNFNVQLYVETCPVRATNPTAKTGLGSAITTATETGVVATVSASSAMLARFGYGYFLSSGSTPASGLVGMDLSLHQCIQPLGAGRVNVPPTLTMNASENLALVVPIGGFVASGVSQPKLKATIVGRDLQNYADMRTKLVYRTAVVQEKPNGWQTGLESDYTPGGSNDERNTGELQVSMGSNRLIQPGLLVRRAGSGVVRGDFDVFVAIIR